MKITKVKIEKFSAPLKEPFRVAFGVIEDADSWTVKIETDEGIYGLGIWIWWQSQNQGTGKC